MTEIIPLDRTKMPAPRNWPSKPKVAELAERLDLLADWCEDFNKAKIALKFRDLSEAQTLIDDFEKTGALNSAKRFEKPGAFPVVDGWCDDDENVRPDAVKVLIGWLIDSYPTSNVPNLPVFMRSMIEAVTELEPTYEATLSACKNVLRDQKFMPSISEVLAAVEAEKEKWDVRYCAPYQVLGLYDLLCKLIPEEKARREAEAIAKEQQKAEWQAKQQAEKKRLAEEKAKREAEEAQRKADIEKLFREVDRKRKAREAEHGFVISSRVRHAKRGTGTVCDVYGDQITVKFDDGLTGVGSASLLEPAP
jgi:hypothetical protein